MHGLLMCALGTFPHVLFGVRILADLLCFRRPDYKHVETIKFPIAPEGHRRRSLTPVFENKIEISKIGPGHRETSHRGCREGFLHFRQQKTKTETHKAFANNHQHKNR